MGVKVVDTPRVWIDYDVLGVALSQLICRKLDLQADTPYDTTGLEMVDEAIEGVRKAFREHKQEAARLRVLRVGV